MIDDNLTRCSYKGIGLQQREEVMTVFSRFLKENIFLRVIEIGTGFGGLTMFIKDNLPASSDIYTFDIRENFCHKNLRENNITVTYENIFKDEVRDWGCYELKEKWISLFNKTPKLIICDGGNKKAEFNGLTQYLNKGDVIMLHDYSTDPDTFKYLNVWNWLECQYKEIENSCEKYNLKPYMKEEFLNIAWGCFIKI